MKKPERRGATRTIYGNGYLFYQSKSSGRLAASKMKPEKKMRGERERGTAWQNTETRESIAKDREEPGWASGSQQWRFLLHREESRNRRGRGRKP